MNITAEEHKKIYLELHRHYFPEIKNNPTLWKYMDLEKLLFIIENNKLYFSRATEFSDPWEGAITRKNQLLLEHDPFFNQHQPTMSKANRDTKEKAFISCWHENDFESAAMWNLYSKTKNAIAIQTDYQTLHSLTKEVDSSINLGRVHYIDYNATGDDAIAISPWNRIFAFMHKRQSFSHEKEFRLAQFDSHHKHSKGKYFKYPANKLIKKIYVSPDADPWFKELLKQILEERYDLAIEICFSEINSEGIF